MSPLSNAFLNANQLNAMEPFYPLHAWVCDKCFLVQLEEFESPAHLFSDYAYFSSYSDTWLAHARDYVERVTQRFGFASADACRGARKQRWLSAFSTSRRAASPSWASSLRQRRKGAEERGIPTLTEFFGSACAQRLAAEGKQADLVVANNVLATRSSAERLRRGDRHAPGEERHCHLEVPHLLRLIQETQFDTIYHEHFSYFSLLVIERLMARHALRVFDVEELRTHGGSLRLYVCHAKARTKPGAALERIRRAERVLASIRQSPTTNFRPARRT